MMPRLGKKYDIEIQTMSKPKAEYITDEYFELELPVAPAIMVGEDIVVEGSDVSDDKVEEAICKQLGLSLPEKQKRSVLARFLKI